jgi:hypothetical protein
LSDTDIIPVKRADIADDLATPTVDLLRDLNLLPTPGDLEAADGPNAAIGGPPQSVALIESGATALAKWWSVAGAGAVGAIWVSVRKFWDGNDPANQRVLLWAAAIVSAAIVLAIGWLFGSDLRCRAQVQSATVQSRADVAKAILRLAEAVHAEPDAAAAANPPPGGPVAPLPSGVKVTYSKHVQVPGRKADWTALAVRLDGDDHNGSDAANVHYLLAQGAIRCGRLPRTSPSDEAMPGATQDGGGAEATQHVPQRARRASRSADLEYAQGAGAGVGELVGDHHVHAWFGEGELDEPALRWCEVERL